VKKLGLLSLVLVFVMLFSTLAFAEDAGIGSIEFIPLEVDDTDEVQPLEGIGPEGQEPVGVDALKGLITDEDAEAIRAAGYKAVLCLHTMNADWSLLQKAGVEAVLKEYNIELLAVTDAQEDPEKQVGDYESAIAMNPDLIITIPLDANAAVEPLRKAVEKGIKLSFIDSVPTGFVAGKDYAGMATADNYANGRVSGELLAEKLDGKGKVAVIGPKYAQFHTEQRTQGALDALAKYPDIEIVTQQQAADANEAATVTESILIAQPELDGIWTFWDAIGMASAGVINNQGKDVIVTSVDLSEDSAYSIASNGALVGIGAQHPYDQGVAEALLGVAALAGKETPSYVLVPGEKVSRKSMERSWNRVFRSPVPDEIAAALAVDPE